MAKLNDILTKHDIQGTAYTLENIQFTNGWVIPLATVVHHDSHGLLLHVRYTEDGDQEIWVNPDHIVAVTIETM